MARVMRLFETPERVSRAVDALHAAGVPDADISLLVRDEREAEQPGRDATTQQRNSGTLSAWSVGMVGGAAGLIASAGLLAVPGFGPVLAVGPLLAALGGGALGATFGGLLGETSDAAEHEAHLQRLVEGLRSGQVLVAVEAPPDRAEEVRSLLDHHAASIESQPFKENPDSPVENVTAPRA